MYFVSCFYRFFPVNDVAATEAALESFAARTGLKGLFILAKEGLNATVAAESAEALAEFKAWLASAFPGDWDFKDSVSDRRPFRRFVVKVRPEIVSLGTPELVPDGDHRHLSPAEWNDVLDSNPDAVLIDTRNWYETQIGKFTGALNPDTEKFSEFPEFMAKNGIAKDRKILIYCTGGIRCEKGLLELERQGFSDVYQLKGGILNYLEKFPDGKFEGECFVFDDRVAVDKNLAPTKTYHLCVHCSQPATERLECRNCGESAFVCGECRDGAPDKVSCSKNCAYHLRRASSKPSPIGSKQASTR